MKLENINFKGGTYNFSFSRYSSSNFIAILMGEPNDEYPDIITTNNSVLEKLKITILSIFKSELTILSMWNCLLKMDWLRKSQTSLCLKIILVLCFSLLLKNLLNILRKMLSLNWKIERELLWIYKQLKKLLMN